MHTSTLSFARTDMNIYRMLFANSKRELGKLNRRILWAEEARAIQRAQDLRRERSMVMGQLNSYRAQLVGAMKRVCGLSGIEYVKPVKRPACFYGGDEILRLSQEHLMSPQG